MERKGFTLLELLIALVMLVIIASIVYASFATVAGSVEVSQASAAELRLHQFLVRSFSTNLSSMQVSQDPMFAFIGEDDTVSTGAADRLTFCSNAPSIGGVSMPGDFKVVQYEIIEEQDSDYEDQGEDEDIVTGERIEAQILQVIETPMLAGYVDEWAEERDYDDEFDPETDYESPMWTIPVRSFDVSYFDGEEWADEWDSLERQQLPWSVRIRINFPKPEAVLDEEAADGLDEEEDADLEMIVPLPRGMGTTLQAAAVNR